jgi:hypothetical protein
LASCVQRLLALLLLLHLLGLPLLVVPEGLLLRLLPRVV